VDNMTYFHNIRHCARLVNSTLFRPPYGRISPKQVQFVQRHYDVVMWDVLSGDFDQDITPAICLQNVIDNAREGSVVVFHDSLKAQENLYYALPRTLEHFAALGYRFQAISSQVINSFKKNFQYEEREEMELQVA
jgi:peptidoglycan-N-acetylglucosamine deacetylase